MFKAIVNIELLKLIFDAVGPEDSKLLVNIVNSRGETMLHASCHYAQYEVIKFLLERGANPTIRDCQGRTPYHHVKAGTMIPLTSYISAFCKMIAFKNWKPNQTELVLGLFENIGGEAVALDDFWLSQGEVERIHSNLDSYPRIGQVCNPLTIARFKFLADNYLSSDSPYLTKLSLAIERDGALQALANSLKSWDIQRRQGLISPNQLPEGCIEFFQEVDEYMEGFLTERLDPDDAIEIKKVLKQYLFDLSKWTVDKKYHKVLAQLERIYLEALLTGAVDEFWENASDLWSMVSVIFSDPSNISIFTKSEAGRKLKACWKCVNRGEILDLLFELTEMTNTTRLIEGFLDSATFEGFKERTKLPASTLWELRLPQRYPGHQMFILTSLPLGPTIYPLFFAQLFVYLFPSLFFLTTLYLGFLAVAYNSTLWFLVFQFWMYHFSHFNWVLFDQYYNIHPNVYRGLRVALEFIWFRLRNLYYIAVDPMILAVKADASGLMSVPQRLNLIKKNALWPIFWLSLRPEDAFAPMPCYSAAADFARKQNDGTLPRTFPISIWNNGWWELEEGTQKKWKRFDANYAPSWAQYCEASKKIKVSLLPSPQTCLTRYRNFSPTIHFFTKSFLKFATISLKPTPSNCLPWKNSLDLITSIAQLFGAACSLMKAARAGRSLITLCLAGRKRSRRSLGSRS
jgi:hypothetical protein